MNDEMRAIESMVIVGVLKYTAAGKEHGNWRDSAAGFGVTLRCHSARDHGACGKRAVGPVRLNSTTRTTLLDCLTELRRKLQEEHGSCIKEREKRIKEILNKEIPKAKPGNWACVQARELWSTEEECTFDLAITGSASWETQVTARAAKRSWSWDLESGKITRARDFTMEIKLSSSRGG